MTSPHEYYLLAVYNSKCCPYVVKISKRALTKKRQEAATQVSVFEVSLNDTLAYTARHFNHKFK